ncbi:unconventional prefoldin RPB5 interactor-like protein isoform X2 [Ooceraea biroi]|uniref:unconventional prefoldin RPB5 interactor-like protein isoform X2 n=1 Tax=Ooceraea biroi TaxID=2015173 RepID=UPI0005BB4987|nr:unconventional prefoldin RPB5 interactor-like protein isoform X2 [Ooceraea biroi]
MDNTAINVATIGPEQIKYYHHMLLNNVLVQLEHNEKQVKIWNEYKDKYKKIIEGLQVYPLSLSEKCMIPVGKWALIRGKLTHTNEVLVCLGSGYFVRYSSSQAIALCNRRIAYADEMLKNLETERNFYEMKQILPLNNDVFEEKDRKDILEYWNEDKLDEWRIQHKQREKEYRQKLTNLREKEEIDIHTEEHLFKRLDELELEEELEDEICRLETEQEKFYNDDLENGEVYDESDDTSSESDVITTEMIEKELREKVLQRNKVTGHTLELNSDVMQNKILNTNPVKSELSDVIINSDQERSLEFRNTSPSVHRRRVSFVEPCAVENEDNTEKEISQRICFTPQDDTHDEDSEDENDIVRIEFSHSSYIPDITEPNTEIMSPGDIYKVFGTPKSILKRSPNDMIPNQISSPLQEDSSTETEDESDHNKYSVYNSVIKEVEDRKISTNIVNNTSKKTDKKEIVSRFKLSRSKRNDI